MVGCTERAMAETQKITSLLGSHNDFYLFTLLASINDGECFREKTNSRVYLSASRVYKRTESCDSKSDKSSLRMFLRKFKGI